MDGYDIRIYNVNRWQELLSMIINDDGSVLIMMVLLYSKFSRANGTAIGKMNMKSQSWMLFMRSWRDILSLLKMWRHLQPS